MDDVHCDDKQMIFRLSYIVSIYVRYLQRKINNHEKGERNRSLGHYDFIPSFGCHSMYRDLQKLKQALLREDVISPRFLDCGCGIGNIMLIAKEVGFRTTGIEYDYDLAKVARDLTFSNVINGDLLEYNKYSKYDVIYYYQPMYRTKKMNEFCELLAEQMHIGAYVIANGTTSLFRESRSFVLEDSTHYSHIFRKVAEYHTL